MRFPTLFLNHGGGPMPLLGNQTDIIEMIRYVRTNILDQYPVQPKAIVMISAHYENDNKIQIMSSSNPPMLYDYYGFPKEAYEFQYNAPGLPDLAYSIETLLKNNNLPCELDDQRGYDHGVFVPLSLLHPEANIPVVCVSLHSTLNPDIHIRLGKALEPLREQDILIIGSGYTFHNMQGFMNPNQQLYNSSYQFNQWLQNTILHCRSYDDMIQSLTSWEQESKPYGRQCHPREEHLLPLLVIAASGKNSKSKLISINDKPSSIDLTNYKKSNMKIFTDYPVSDFIFE